MNSKKITNIAISIRARLLSQAKQKREDFNFVLSRYGAERLLYRLSQSKYKQNYVLKGATLFRVWNGELHRATKDLDLLSFGTNEVLALIQTFQEVCSISCEEDGIEFQAPKITGEKIKEAQEYEGVRIKIPWKLGSSKNTIQIDIGFGDAITPPALLALFPPLLDLPPPVLQVYPRETVIAEKFQAMVSLGIKNSRLKDFYDLLFLLQSFEFQGNVLSQAFHTTFERRKTPLPTNVPLALTEEFAKDPLKEKQWEAFIKKGNVKLDTEYLGLNEVTTRLQVFLMPPCLAAANNKAFQHRWKPPGPWR